MNFKKFTLIIVAMIISVNLVVAFEPLIVIEIQRKTENSIPVKNGDYYYYTSSGLGEIIGFRKGGIPCEVPISISLNLTIANGKVEYHMKAIGEKLQNVSNLGYHRFVNVTKCYGINSSYVENFIFPVYRQNQTNFLEIENESFGFLKRVDYCGNFGNKFAYTNDVNGYCYGMDGPNVTNGGSNANNYVFLKSGRYFVLSSLTIFDANPNFVQTMMNDTSFTNVSIYGAFTFFLTLEKTNVEFDPLDYSYYVFYNFNINLIFTIASTIFLLSIYSVLRKRKRI